VPHSIATSIDPVRYKYSCHIDIRKPYLRELCLSGRVKPIPLRTHHMVADALTRSLPDPDLVRHRTQRHMMGHCNLCAYPESHFWRIWGLYGFAQ